MNIIITGGCGFIGSNFVRYFHHKYPHHNLMNVDKLTYAGNLENVRDFARSKGYNFVKADIANRSAMRTLFKKFRPDALINFAAETHVDRSIMTPSRFLQSNILGVNVLLDLCLEYQLEKFVQISTDEVYGSCLRGTFKEKDPLAPSSPYAASKAAADALVMAYYKTYNAPVVITRSSNNYGPYQFPEKLIPLVIINALNNKKIPIYGDGKNIRDWLYVLDNCRAIDLVFHRGTCGEIYNIAGEQELTNISVVKNILRALHRGESLITYVKDRPGHDRRYALSIHKMRKHIGWHPTTSFREGIKKTIHWYKNNTTWLMNTQTGAYRTFYKSYYTSLGLKT